MTLLLKRFAALTAVIMFGAGALSASAEEWNFDSTHFSVSFSVSHLGVSNQHGRFNEMTGEITTGESASFAFTVPAESVDTNNAKRDDHLRGPDFFNTKQFPDITFASTSAVENENGYELTGDLTLHGVTNPITVQLNKIGEIDDPWGNHRAGFETTFKINRSDYGMSNMLEAIGDEVTLTIGFEALRK